MIVTAQPFLNELDLLELKFEELGSEVDAHIVIEASHTFTGIPKPLLFAQHAERFKKWNIIYRAVNLPPTGDDPWVREEIQYNYMRSVVAEVAPRICLWLDADELPRSGSVQRFLDSGKKGATLEMDYLMYDWEHWNARQPWHNSKIGYYDKDTPQLWRGTVGLPIIDNAGWHCEYFGGKDALLMKLKSTSHAVEPEVKFFRKAVADGGSPGLEQCEPYPKEKCPRVIRDAP